MLIPKEKITSYIPQREPFVMIDNLLSASKDRFETDFIILNGNIFLEDGVLRELAMIENIGQSSSVGLIFTKAFEKKLPVDGYIGAISKLSVFALPRVNDQIRTIVTLITSLENMFLMKGECFLGDKILLECNVKLVAI